jgi:hypothetical protein
VLVLQVKVSSLSAKAAATGETRQQPGAFCFSAQLDGVVPPWVADRLCCVLAEAQGDGGLRVSCLQQVLYSCHWHCMTGAGIIGWQAAGALHRPRGWTRGSRRWARRQASC